MKKLVLFASGVGGTIAMAVIGTGVASANAPDVTGETYGKAVAILHAQGYSAVFGGSVGSDLPQSQCVVSNQRSIGTSGKSNAILPSAPTVASISAWIT